MEVFSCKGLHLVLFGNDRFDFIGFYHILQGMKESSLNRQYIEARTGIIWYLNELSVNLQLEQN